MYEFLKDIPPEQRIEGQSDIDLGAVTINPATEEGQEFTAGGLDLGGAGYTGDLVTDTPRSFLSGFNEMVLGTPDFVINQIAELGEAAGVIPPNVDTRNYLNRLFNSGDYEEMRKVFPFVYVGLGKYAGGPDSVTQNIARGAGQGLGLGAFTGALTKIGAKLYEKTAPKLDDVADRVRRVITERYTKAPVAAGVAEAEYGILGGAGGKIEEEITGTSTGIGALTLPTAWAGLKGVFSTIATLSPVRFFSNKASQLADDIRVSQGQDPKTDDAVIGGPAKKTIDALDKENRRMVAQNRENLKRSIEIQKKVGETTGDDVPMSVAEGTLDPIGLKRQSLAEGRMDPNEAAKNIERKKSWFTSFNNFLNNTTDLGRYDESIPTIIFDRIKNKIDLTVRNIDDATGEIKNNIETVLKEEDFPTVKRPVEERGKTIQSNLNTIYKNAMDSVDKKAKQLKINQTNVNATDASKQEVLQKTLNDVLQGRLEAVGGKGINKQILTIVKDIQDGKKITFQSWKATNENLNSELGKQLNLGNGQQVRDLQNFIQVWNTMKFRGKGGEAVENLDQFKQYYLDTIVIPFRNAAVSKVLAKSSGSPEKNPIFLLEPERVARQFLNSSKDMETYLAINKDNPEMIKHLQEAFKDKMFDQSFNNRTGALDVQKLANNMNKFAEDIVRLKLDGQFTTIDDALKSLIQREQSLITRKKVIDSNIVVREIAKLSKDNRPAELIDKALASKNNDMIIQIKKQIDKIAAQENDPNIKTAFNALVMNRIMANAPEISGEIMGSPRAFKAFLEGGEQKLRGTLGDEHYENLLLVADGMIRVLATDLNPGTSQPISSIFQKIEKQLGTSTRQLTTRALEAESRRVAPRTVIGFITSRAAMAQAGIRADKIIQESMYNPSLAKFLGEETPESGPTKQQLKKFNEMLLKMGLYGGLTEDRPQEAPNIMIDIGPGASVTPTEEPPVQVAEITRPTNIPNPGMPQNNRITTSVADLFPNDATSASIGRRRQGGITSLV